MALTSTGSKADTIAHGGSVSNASGQKGMMRVRTGSRIEYHDGTKWILDLSLPAFGNGKFNFNKGDATNVASSGSTPTANLATGSTSTTTYSINKTVTDGWVANKPPSGTIGWVDMALSANARTMTPLSKTGYTSITKKTIEGKDCYQYHHRSVGGKENFTIAGTSNSATSLDLHRDDYSATHHTALYKDEDGNTQHPTYVSYFLAIL